MSRIARLTGTRREAVRGDTEAMSRRNAPPLGSRRRRRRVVSLLGASRHSALPTVRRHVGSRARPIAVRIAALGCGSLLIGTAVALLVQADLGLAPYDVLSSGLAGRLGITLGQAGWAIAGLLFAVAALLGRRPSLWGVAYIASIGLAIDGTGHLLNAPVTMPGRVAFLLAAIVVMSIGINLVLFSGTTGGPFELLMAAGEQRGLRRIHVRYGLDGGVLLIGIAIGGSFGVGTLVFAALMGPTFAVTSQVLIDYDAGRRLRLSMAEPGPAELAGSGDGDTPEQRPVTAR